MKKIWLLSFLTCAFLWVNGQEINKAVRISGNAGFLKDGDSVSLKIYKYGIINQEPSFQENLTVTAQNHQFKFVVPGKSYPQYINLTFKEHSANNLYYYVIAGGDDIELDFGNELVIEGKKSANFNIQRLIRQIEEHYNRTHKQPNLTAFTLEKIFNDLDSLADVQQKFLSSKRNEISGEMFQFLRTNIEATAQWTKYYDLTWTSPVYRDSSINPLIGSVKEYQQKHGNRIMPFDSVACYNSFFTQYLIEKYKVDSCLLKNKPFDVVSCLDFLMRNYKGMLREQLITTLITTAKSFPAGLNQKINKALSVTTNTNYSRVLLEISKTRFEGANAVDFSFQNPSGRLVKASDFKGQVLIVDFWYTGCGNCRELAPFMKKIEQDFTGKPVRFISVSIDKNKEQWLNSVKGGQYVSPEIVNLYTAGKGDKDKSLLQLRINSYPTLLLITKSGSMVNLTTDPRLDNGHELSMLIQKQL
ncbi:TlpA family protein disulfide reductase [Mucilaginibacter sp. RCC_168]